MTEDLIEAYKRGYRDGFSDGRENENERIAKLLMKGEQMFGLGKWATEEGIQQYD